MEENIVIKAKTDEIIKSKDKHDEISTKWPYKGRKSPSWNFEQPLHKYCTKTVGLSPKTLGKSTLAKDDGESVAKVVKRYENYPKIFKIRENQHANLTFVFPKDLQVT